MGTRSAFATSATTYLRISSASKAGETFTVTEHGRPIARLVRDDPPSERLLELADQGRVTLADGAARCVGTDIPHIQYEGSIQDLMDEIRGE